MIGHVADCPVCRGRVTLLTAVACSLVLAGLDTRASCAPAMPAFTSPEGERPGYVRQLEENFRAPSKSGFGGTVLFAPEAKAATLDEAAVPAAFGHAAVSELLVSGIGDGYAMSGLFVTARRANGNLTDLVFLMA